jgi:hypothetical protein
MNAFIQKLSYTADHQQVYNELNDLLNTFTQWHPENQIGLRHRAGCINPWKDSVGSLHDKIKNIKIGQEKDFSSWNDNCPAYTLQALEDLATKEDITWGRIRFMLLLPKTGLSMHMDDEPRYHLVLKTNPNCIFGECFKNSSVRSIGYHIPADGHWYKVDTTREHFVYNGSAEPRIHLVACPVV